MAYRITTKWNDGTVTTVDRSSFAAAQKFARRIRDIANVVSVTIGSASWPQGTPAAQVAASVGRLKGEFAAQGIDINSA